MISLGHSNRRYHNWLIYKINDRFLKMHSDKMVGTLYDLGCGEAPYKEFFLEKVKNYIGVDWEGSIHKTKVDVIADLNKPLPIDNQIADTIVSLSVLEHLSEPINMLTEAHRILKPDGVLLLQVPWQWWIHEAPYDFFRYSPYGLKYLLEKSGFKDIEVEAQSGFFSMWILKFNYFLRRLIKGPKPLRLALLALSIPIWYLGQCLAPYLDKIDTNWSAETTGFFVIARK